MTQQPEQTTPSHTSVPSEEKADWKKQFDQQFVKDNGQDIEPSFKDPNGDVGPVKQFIQTQIEQAKAEARAEVLEEVLHKVFPGKLGPGDPSIDPDGAEYKRGWDEALTQYYKNIQALESKQH